MNNSYVLITPARNEEAYIEKTIQSVISQTILPKKWVIVSDGSTDCTDEIVKRHEVNYDFIQLLHREPDISRNFASKVYAIQAGIKELYGIEYDFIGNLDADVSFEPNYYEHILKKFQENQKLGIAGGALYESLGKKWVRQVSNHLWSVSGPIQMFRRLCLDDIGGYLPIKKGGVDTIAEVMARMRGWHVRAFPELSVFHHRYTGNHNANIFSARFEQGVKEYFLNNHPLFEIAKCILRIKERPFLLGSILRFTGYIYAHTRKEERNVPIKVVKFMRHEQIQRLLNVFLK